MRNKGIKEKGAWRKQRNKQKTRKRDKWIKNDRKKG
jgi:hypothetical protein